MMCFAPIDERRYLANQLMTPWMLRWNTKARRTTTARAELPDPYATR